MERILLIQGKSLTIQPDLEEFFKDSIWGTMGALLALEIWVKKFTYHANHKKQDT